MQTELMTTVSPNNRGLISVWPPGVAEDSPWARTAHLCLRGSILALSVQVKLNVMCLTFLF